MELKKLWIASPFFVSRGSYPLDMIIIHHIGSDKGKLYSIGGTITWFTSTEVHKNPKTGAIENQVSAHYAIPREPHKDYDVVQFVQDADIAYHAGESQWVINGKTRKYINCYSIGIELEGDGNLVEYTDYQYDTLISLVADLKNKYNIPENNIVGHEDIAPTRKVDPGKFFDWKRLRTGINPPAPPVVVPTQPITQPAAPPQIEKVPDTQFFMGSGKAKPTNFFEVLVGIVLKMFRLS